MSEPVERVTIRVQPGKELVYPEFKDLVTKNLGSDVCYVTTALWEAFNQAIKSAPNPADPLTLRFLRQSIQLNIGCNFNYNVKKARRSPPGPGPLPEVKLDRNHILPGLLEMWPTLKPGSKQFWREKLLEAGVLPGKDRPQPREAKALPSVSTGTPKATITEKPKPMEHSMTFDAALNVGSVGGVGKAKWLEEREDYLAGRGEF